MAAVPPSIPESLEALVDKMKLPFPPLLTNEGSENIAGVLENHPLKRIIYFHSRIAPAFIPSS
jgi:hypothetical protein